MNIRRATVYMLPMFLKTRYIWKYRPISDIFKNIWSFRYFQKYRPDQLILKMRQFSKKGSFSCYLNESCFQELIFILINKYTRLFLTLQAFWTCYHTFVRYLDIVEELSINDNLLSQSSIAGYHWCFNLPQRPGSSQRDGSKSKRLVKLK